VGGRDAAAATRSKSGITTTSPPLGVVRWEPATSCSCYRRSEKANGVVGSSSSISKSVSRIVSFPNRSIARWK
jgi:hypothetical protein